MTDPATNDFTISYTYRSNEADIGTSTVTYTVTSQFYTSITNTGTFTLTIICPPNTLSSSIITYTAAQTYDIDSGMPQTVTPPVVDFTPNSCFTI